MIEQIDLTNILFLDIETVPAMPNFEDLDEMLRDLWAVKARQFLKKSENDITTQEIADTYDRAGIYAEFGKIICISVGRIRNRDGKMHVYLKSYASDDETKLLKDFSQLLEKQPEPQFLCGHNIKEFDIPYICRRLIINQLPLPKLLNLYGKKPWETKQLLDTMELWKFGDNKNYTSIKLLSAVLGFPSPKDDIDGSEVCRVYWEEKDLPRIAIYCEKDVLAVVQLLQRLRLEPIFETNQVTHVK